MDVKQMLYIVTIAKEGGISRAAAKLFITQSALDQQLLKLGARAGRPRWFCRSRGSLSLTEAGRVYVDYAEKMLAMKNEAYRVIHDIADQRRGTLAWPLPLNVGWKCLWTCTPASTGTILRWK